MRFYPVMLNISSKRVVIIGAGKVALRKIEGLVGCGADIVVASPDPRPEKLDENITYVQKNYTPSLLDNADLVYACTDDAKINSQIADDARNRKILVNSVDDPPNCDFFAPAQIIRDGLTVAIGTSGQAPSIAKYLRKKISRSIDQSLGQYVRFVAQIRDELKSQNATPQEKQLILSSLASDEFFGIFQNHGPGEVKKRLANLELLPGAQPALQTSHRILCAGINHKTATVEIREKFALDPEAANRILEKLKSSWPEAQFMVLSTCNRTEIYCMRKLHSHPREDQLLDFLKAFSNSSCGDELFYVHQDSAAGEHLFKVTAGLDSMIPGEDQIVTQVKDAWNASIAAGVCRKQLNLLVQSALHTAKHIRHETQLTRGRTSIASAAVDLVEKNIPRIDNKNVFVIGAGKTASLVIEHIKRLGDSHLQIIRKNPQHENELSPAGLPNALLTADLIICASSAPHHLISTQMLKDIKRDRPLVIVDLAVPRDVEPSAGELENIRLYDIDALAQVASKHKAARLGVCHSADSIIADHIKKLFDELEVHHVSPTLQAMYRRVKMIEKQELEAAFSKLPSGNLDNTKKIIRHTVHRSIRRILHPLVEKLRTSSTSPKIKKYLAAVEELFDLDF